MKGEINLIVLYCICILLSLRILVSLMPTPPYSMRVQRRLQFTGLESEAQHSVIILPTHSNANTE